MVLPRAHAIALLMAVLAIAVAPSVAADGHGDTQQDGGSDDGPVTHEVTIREWRWSPRQIDITLGDRIRFLNAGNQDHYIIAQDESYEFRLRPGQSEVVTYDELGTELAYCFLHCADYHGRIICNENVIINVQDPNDTGRNDAPRVRVDQPFNGSLVWGSVDIEGSVTDPNGPEDIRRIGIWIDDGPLIDINGTLVDGALRWSFQWNASAMDPGPHTIHVGAADSRNLITVQNVTVDVADGEPGDAALGNDPPRVRIDQPTGTEPLWDATVIRGTARDATGDVLLVQVRIDHGPWLTADGTGVWHLPLLPQRLGPGEHTVEARSFDGLGHSDIARVDFTVAEPASTDEELATFNGATPDDEQNDTPGPAALVALLAIAGVATLRQRRR